MSQAAGFSETHRNELRSERGNRNHPAARLRGRAIIEYFFQPVRTVFTNTGIETAAWVDAPRSHPVGQGYFHYIDAAVPETPTGRNESYRRTAAPGHDVRFRFLAARTEFYPR